MAYPAHDPSPVDEPHPRPEPGESLSSAPVFVPPKRVARRTAFGDIGVDQTAPYVPYVHIQPAHRTRPGENDDVGPVRRRRVDEEPRTAAVRAATLWHQRPTALLDPDMADISAAVVSAVFDLPDRGKSNDRLTLSALTSFACWADEEYYAEDDDDPFDLADVINDPGLFDEWLMSLSDLKPETQRLLRARIELVRNHLGLTAPRPTRKVAVPEAEGPRTATRTAPPSPGTGRQPSTT